MCKNKKSNSALLFTVSNILVIKEKNKKSPFFFFFFLRHLIKCSLEGKLAPGQKPNAYISYFFSVAWMKPQVLRSLQKQLQIKLKDKLGFMPFWVQSAHRGLLNILVKTEFEPGSKDESPQTNLLSYQAHCHAGL